jgi:hypothetical protein
LNHLALRLVDMSTNRPTVVLIPDAWHGVEYFDEYRRHLGKLGFPSLSVPLSSIRANPPHPNIYGDVADIRSALLSLINMGKEVILAMHSYGGLPGSEAINGLSKTERMEQGMPGGIITLLYIAAFLLPLDRSFESFETMFHPSTPCWEHLGVGNFHVVAFRYSKAHVRLHILRARVVELISRMVGQLSIMISKRTKLLSGSADLKAPPSGVSHPRPSILPSKLSTPSMLSARKIVFSCPTGNGT